MTGLDEDTTKKIVDEIKKLPQISEAILFGSRALGTYKNGSDVDIAVKGKEVDISSIWSLLYNLNEKGTLPFMFDIIHYDRVKNKALKEHIDQFGVTIYPKNAL